MKERFPEKNVEQYDVIGEQYLKEKRDFFSTTPDLAKQAIFEYIKHLHGKKGVDVGCGGGSELKQFRELGTVDIVGVDPSEVMIRAAKELNGSENAALGKWTKLPFPDHSQDFLVGRFSLHYEENLDGAYTEAARVLKPGGSLIVTLPHPDSEKDIIVKDGKEYVSLSLFNDTVPLVYPRHKLDDYFSDTFHTFFEVVKRENYSSPERKTPGVDAFVLIARRLGLKNDSN